HVSVNDHDEWCLSLIDSVLDGFGFAPFAVHLACDEGPGRVLCRPSTADVLPCLAAVVVLDPVRHGNSDGVRRSAGQESLVVAGPVEVLSPIVDHDGLA